jgi:hypothetical protein
LRGTKAQTMGPMVSLNGRRRWGGCYLQKVSLLRHG